MAAAKLSAPVGEKERSDGGKPVANTASDVALVQQMLKANGFNVSVNGKMNAGLKKAIGVAQKKITKLKTPDHIIDPGGRTFKSLNPAYAKYMADLAKQKHMSVKIGSKSMVVSETEYKKLCSSAANALKPFAATMRAQHDANAGMLKEYTETANLKDGLAGAITKYMTMSMPSVKLPDPALETKSAKAIGELETAVRKADLAGIAKAAPAAEAALAAFSAGLSKFLATYMGSKQMISRDLKVTGGKAFDLITGLVAPAIVPAKEVAETGYSALEATVGELKSLVSGQKPSLWKSIQSDSIFDTVKDIIGDASDALSSKTLLEIAKDIAKLIISKVQFSPAAELAKAILLFLENNLGNALTNAVKRATEKMGEIARKGKIPTPAQFKEAVVDLLIKPVMDGPVKLMLQVKSKLQSTVKNLLTSSLIPNLLRTVLKAFKLTAQQLKSFTTNLVNAVMNGFVLFGTNLITHVLKGVEKSATVVLKALVDMMKTNAKLLKGLEKSARSELKRMKLEPA